MNESMAQDVRSLGTATAAASVDTAMLKAALVMQQQMADMMLQLANNPAGSGGTVNTYA